jgi:hypothetical protein
MPERECSWHPWQVQPAWTLSTWHVAQAGLDQVVGGPADGPERLDAAMIAVAGDAVVGNLGVGVHDATWAGHPPGMKTAIACLTTRLATAEGMDERRLIASPRT